MINIMELVEKEEGRKKKTPFIDYVLWKGTLEGMIDDRAEQYPTLSICNECVENCKQVQVAGLFRFYCGIKGLNWRP